MVPMMTSRSAFVAAAMAAAIDLSGEGAVDAAIGGYDTLRRLDKSGMGFPQKEAMWGKRRYWPAVKAYFDEKYSVKSGSSYTRSR